MRLLLLTLFRALAVLPLPILHFLGAGAGWLVYFASPAYRKHLNENLALAMAGHLSAGSLSSMGHIRRAAIAAAGRMSLELPKIWLNPLSQALDMVREVRGWECVEAAQAAGRGIVFLTPHLGCFELTAQYFSSRAPITVLYRPSRSPVLQEMILQGRARPALHLAAADLSGVRSLIRALKRGEAVGLLPDQAPRQGEGKWLPFFGKPAYTMTLAARLTETGATVVLAYGERLTGKGVRLHFRQPSAPIEGDLETRAMAINREIEALIREFPGQYLWGYNRYKQPRGAASPQPEAVSGKGETG